MVGRDNASKPVNQTGAILRGYREARGYKQKDLSEATGIKQSVISDLELGKTDFTWHYCKLMATALGTTVTALARETDLLPEGVLAEEDAKLSQLQAQHPDILGFLARVESLPPEARHRFNLAMRKMVELEEELEAERAHDRDSQATA